jgi:hypothetical protein
VSNIRKEGGGIRGKKDLEGEEYKEGRRGEGIRDR